MSVSTSSFVSFFSAMEIPLTPFQTFLTSIGACWLTFLLTPRSWELATRTIVPSTVHAIVSSFFSVKTWVDFWPALLAGDASVWLEVRNHDRCVGALTCGYILYDTLMCAYLDGSRAAERRRQKKKAEESGQAPQKPPTKDKPLLSVDMLVHHAIAGYTTATGALGLLGTALSSIFILSEISTPFVNLHHFLPATSSLRVPNGFAMFLVFGGVRIGLLGVVARTLWLTAVPEVISANPVLYYSQIGAVTPLYFLNAYWFSRITQGLLKRLRELFGGKGGRKAGEAPAPVPPAPAAQASPASGGSRSGAAAQPVPAEAGMGVAEPGSQVRARRMNTGDPN